MSVIWEAVLEFRVELDESQAWVLLSKNRQKLAFLHFKEKDSHLSLPLPLLNSALK